MVDQEKIKREFLSHPAAARVVLRVIATKLCVDDDLEFPQPAEKLAEKMQEALDIWENKVAGFQAASGLSEEQCADELIKRLRTDPRYGWDRILRGNAS